MKKRQKRSYRGSSNKEMSPIIQFAVVFVIVAAMVLVGVVAKNFL